MCGITGFWSTAIPKHDLKSVAYSMVDKLIARGPDDRGAWVDKEKGIALGHRRLSIQDLSSAGHQPMVSCCSRFILAFNGEIYNHKKLRKKLEEQQISTNWQGHSDTETLLACFLAWGIEKTLKATVGMFALALYDTYSCVLTLARDRMGEKPLYYGWQGDEFIFGSELKALKAHPSFCGEIDRNSIALLLRHNCIPAPYSIYVGIQKLMPGCYFNVSLKNIDHAKNAKPEKYWSLNHIVEMGLRDPFTGGKEAAVDLLHKQLSSSINDQLCADVPVGVFLSGGIDSSVIAVLAQEKSQKPVSTFSLGFNEGGYEIGRAHV